MTEILHRHDATQVIFFFITHNYDGHETGLKYVNINSLQNNPVIISALKLHNPNFSPIPGCNACIDLTSLFHSARSVPQYHLEGLPLEVLQGTET